MTRTPRATHLRCSKCGALYSRAAWSVLTLFERLLPSNLRSAVLGWPDDCCIEVRVCVICGNGIPAECELMQAG
jgi:hypothetical protein